MSVHEYDWFIKDITNEVNQQVPELKIFLYFCYITFSFFCVQYIQNIMY